MSQLVLFDIDGTLIRHFQSSDAADSTLAVRVERFASAVRHTFGVEAEFDKKHYTGMTDRQIIWEMVKDTVPRDVFEEKFRHIGPHMHDMLKQASEKRPLYQPIEPSVRFLKRIAADDRFRIGVITGNVESIALWKLDAAGIARYFRFGLYGDDADNRIELAKLAITRANAFFHESFAPEDITVIGDTVYDIRCGQAIGARVVAVTGGGHSAEALAEYHPDLLTDSLESPESIAFFGLAPEMPGAV